MHNHAVTKSPTIIQVYGGSPKKRGSLEEYFLRLTRELYKHGYKSVFVFNRKIDQELEKAYEDAGAKIILIANTEKRFNPTTVFRFWQLFYKVRPALVNFHFGRTSFNATISARICGINNTVWTKHSFNESGPFYQKLSIFKKLRSLIFLQGCLSKRIIAVSEGLKKELLLYHLPESKIVRIYLGVNLERFSRGAISSSTLLDLKIEGHHKVVACISQARPEKGLEYLIRAVPRVAEKIDNLKVLILGGGPLTEALEDLSVELGVQHNILFCGVRNDVEDIIALSEFTVLPSLTEGLPLALVESIASKKPVITTGVGGIPEAVTNGANGILIPPKDEEALAHAMIELLSAPNLLRKMSDDCAQKALQFDVRNGVEKTISLYKKVMKFNVSY